MTPHPRLLVDATDGRVSLRDGLGGDWLAPIHAAVAFADGTLETTEGAARGESGVDGLVVRVPGNDRRVELRWQWQLRPADAAVMCWLEVHNTTSRPVTIERLDVLVAPDGFCRAAYVELQVAPMGWQSWSHAAPLVPLAQLRPVSPPITAPMRPPSELAGTLLPGMVRLATPDGHRLLAGFCTAADQSGTLSLQPATTGHRLSASTDLEGLVLPPGGTIASEVLWLSVHPSDEAALARYASELARELGARVPARAPVGWCSWYHYFEAVTEADMLANLATLTHERDRLPVDLVQLDDGYQTAIGDWLSLNDKFPAGLRALTDRIHADGYQAGIWLAPFLVAEDADVARAHPEWLLKDAAGLPLRAIYNWGRVCHALDLTHPEVEARVREVFRTIVEDWGFDYLKIDFIYAGALRGQRHEAGVTGVQAYRRGLGWIREIAGDRFVLGCGAPFLASIGLVDGMRVGPDTAPHWSSEDPEGSAPALQNAIRSTLAHGWMHQRFWANDPDCVIAREAANDLTRAEVETWASVIALSGGMVLFSDDLSTLEPSRLALLPRLLPPTDRTALASGPPTDGLPAALLLDGLATGGAIHGRFNWEDAPAELTYVPPGADPYHLVDLWGGTHTGPVAGPLPLGFTGPHGVRLFAVHADLGHPQVVGTRMHLLGGTELTETRWADGALTLAARWPGAAAGEVLVWVPAGFRGAGVVGPALAVVEVPCRTGEAVRVPFER